MRACFAAEVDTRPASDRANLRETPGDADRPMVRGPSRGRPRGGSRRPRPNPLEVGFMQHQLESPAQMAPTSGHMGEELFAMLRGLRRGWYYIAISAVVGLALGLVYAWRATTTYQATARLLILEQGGASSPAPGSPSGRRGRRTRSRRTSTSSAARTWPGRRSGTAGPEGADRRVAHRTPHGDHPRHDGEGSPDRLHGGDEGGGRRSWTR